MSLVELVSTIAGGFGSGHRNGNSSLDVKFNDPIAICAGPDRHTCYIVDAGNHCIRRLINSSGGTIGSSGGGLGSNAQASTISIGIPLSACVNSVVVDSNEPPASSSNPTASALTLNTTISAYRDRDRCMYIADGNRILRVIMERANLSAASIAQAAAKAAAAIGSGVVQSSSSVYQTESELVFAVIGPTDPHGLYSTARAICLSPDGAFLYVCDEYNCRILKIPTALSAVTSAAAAEARQPVPPTPSAAATAALADSTATDTSSSLDSKRPIPPTTPRGNSSRNLNAPQSTSATVVVTTNSPRKPPHRPASQSKKPRPDHEKWHWSDSLAPTHAAELAYQQKSARAKLQSQLPATATAGCGDPPLPVPLSAVAAPPQPPPPPPQAEPPQTKTDDLNAASTVTNSSVVVNAASAAAAAAALNGTNPFAVILRAMRKPTTTSSHRPGSAAVTTPQRSNTTALPFSSTTKSLVDSKQPPPPPPDYFRRMNRQNAYTFNRMYCCWRWVYAVMML